MEAVILNFIDDLDSKINGVRTHIDREPDSESSWTQYHRCMIDTSSRGLQQNQTLKVTSINRSKRDPSQLGLSERAGSGQPRSRFSNTLGEQLQGVNLDLLGSQKQDKNDE